MLLALLGGAIAYGTGRYEWVPAGMVAPLIAFRFYNWLMANRERQLDDEAERKRQSEQDTLQLIEKARQEMLAIEASELSEIEQRHLKGKVKQVLEQRLPASPSDENERLLPPGNPS